MDQPMAGALPGTYVITSSGKTTAVEDADRWDYDPEGGGLRVWKDGEIVAAFRWWDSITRKAD